jgi:superfamily II DNA or RNA helicase
VTPTTDRRWAGTGEAIGRAAATVSAETLAAYREAPRLIEEHHNLELAAVEGGYGRRQLFELIQNGADELLHHRGRIQVVLTDNALYCANQGTPLSVEGLRALQFSHLSAKKGLEIGRFGLGFKSVLGITRTPEIFSTSGSVCFDAAHARRSISEVVGREVGKVPTLRLALPVDADHARGQDPVLAELMAWATTVVRLSRDTEDSSWLHANIDRFPAEFLLFSPHVNSLVLEDHTRDIRRAITLRRQGGGWLLVEGGTESVWQVFHTTHSPSRGARADAGRHADRDEIPLSWAVPTQRRRRGEFWAFFPTLDSTTLSGVLNAPWKLNEDRTRVIDGVFNKELLEAACELVMTNLEDLASDEDPGLVLDLLPGRGRELLGWADETVTTCINSQVGLFPCVPDQEGQLDLCARLRIHPSGIPREALELWSRTPGRPADWAHPSVETRERRPRVDTYMATAATTARPVNDWLEALVRVDRQRGSASALRVAAATLGAEGGKFDEEIRAAQIVPTESKGLVSLDHKNLFLRAPLDLVIDATFVAADLANEPGVADALERLGVRPIEPVLLLRSLLSEDVGTWEPPRWDLVWELARHTDPLETKREFEAAGLGRRKIQVRTAGGRYVRLVAALLPGTVVPQLSIEDHAVLIDTSFHSGEADLLKVLGATPAPTHNGGGQDEPWFSEYEKEALTEYVDAIRDYGASPSREYLKFAARPFAGPITPMRLLSDGAKARYASALFSVAQDLGPWTFGHTTQARYPKRFCPHPIVWMVRKHGVLETSLGLRKPTEAVAPTLSRFAQLLPVARIGTDAADALGLPSKVGELSEKTWAGLLDRVKQIDQDAVIGLAYLAAATSDVPRPEEIRCRVGRSCVDRPAQTVAVTADEALARVFVQTSHPFIRVSREEEALALVQRWGLRPASEAVRTEVSWTPAGEPEPLIDAFPVLRIRLDDDQRLLQLVPCADLRTEAVTEGGKVSTDRPLVLHDDRVYFRTDLGDRRLLEEISRSLDLGLDGADIEAMLQNLDLNRIRRLRSEIRAADDNEARLLMAVGSDALRRRIPKTLVDAVEKIYGSLDDRGTAALALVVHGVRVLQEHVDELEQRGLTPPARWAGTRRAVQFTRQLGFEAEYAGFHSPAPAAVLEVEGRPELGPLHDYQQVVVGEIRSLLRGEDGYRGLLSLPTGAGKTRVTIEALVDAIAERELSGPLLWVAQTEELCEQAVQTWSEIWRAFGPTQRLTISRLWKHYEAEESEHGEQVVVATVQKLDGGIFEKQEYKWLARATCLVVDEAHSSVGQQYTRLLDWQEMGRGRQRAPLIGLTATPFRGTNVEETRRLVSRYGGRRLDLLALGGADAYPHLQAMGILSQVEHELLPGSEVKLSATELAQLEQTRTLPPEASRNLGADVERNRTLLESVQQLDAGWPVLLFATSVEHAQVMAALLAREGIAAAAITGQTDKAVRRHYVERFRAGDLQVLTNFNVLTAGFDAPKVRAVYVARPTYSANVYQQMIGRGLRGPLNGGTETCRLVNVADNVLQYGERLAFHEFDYLWSPEPGNA